MHDQSTNHTTTAPLRLIPITEVMRRVSLGRSTIYDHMKQGRFPKARRIGTRRSAWVEAEVDQWIAALNAA